MSLHSLVEQDAITVYRRSIDYTDYDQPVTWTKATVIGRIDEAAGSSVLVSGAETIVTRPKAYFMDGTDVVSSDILLFDGKYWEVLQVSNPASKNKFMEVEIRGNEGEAPST